MSEYNIIYQNQIINENHSRPCYPCTIHIIDKYANGHKSYIQYEGLTKLEYTCIHLLASENSREYIVDSDIDSIILVAAHLLEKIEKYEQSKKTGE